MVLWFHFAVTAEFPIALCIQRRVSTKGVSFTYGFPILRDRGLVVYDIVSSYIIVFLFLVSIDRNNKEFSQFCNTVTNRNDKLI